MPTISEMRLYLMSRYPHSLNWHKKVQNMSTRQIVAIYKRMKELENKNLVHPHNDSNYHQIDMFEYLASLNQTRTEVNV
jgi:hypothetical protein